MGQGATYSTRRGHHWGLKAQSERPWFRLFNTMMDLVFTKEELASSTQLGLKGTNKSRCLDKEKVAAIKGKNNF